MDTSLLRTASLTGFAALTLSIGLAPDKASAFSLTNSNTDFSSVLSSVDGWQYGYFDENQGFQQFTNFSEEQNGWIGAEGIHTADGGRLSADSDISLVRRWNSNFNGNLDISIDFDQILGTEVEASSTFKLLHNGELQTLEMTNTGEIDGGTYSFNLDVTEDSVLDFLIAPQTQENIFKLEVDLKVPPGILFAEYEDWEMIADDRLACIVGDCTVAPELDEQSFQDIHATLGGNTGSLGTPTSDINEFTYISPNGKSHKVWQQDFATGSIIQSHYGTFPVMGDIGAGFYGEGSYGETPYGGYEGYEDVSSSIHQLGVPLTGEIGLGDGVLVQYFDRGRIIHDHYGRLRNPITGQQVGLLIQHNQAGLPSNMHLSQDPLNRGIGILSSDKVGCRSGACNIPYDVDKAAAAEDIDVVHGCNPDGSNCPNGGVPGVALGAKDPNAPEPVMTDNLRGESGWRQSYVQGATVSGRIYHTVYGVYPVLGGMYGKYSELGEEKSELGFPTTFEINTGSSIYQYFEGGRMVIDIANPNVVRVEKYLFPSEGFQSFSFKPPSSGVKVGLVDNDSIGTVLESSINAIGNYIDFLNLSENGFLPIEDYHIGVQNQHNFSSFIKTQLIEMNSSPIKSYSHYKIGKGDDGAIIIAMKNKIQEVLNSDQPSGYLEEPYSDDSGCYDQGYNNKTNKNFFSTVGLIEWSVEELGLAGTAGEGFVDDEVECRAFEADDPNTEENFLNSSLLKIIFDVCLLDSSERGTSAGSEYNALGFSELCYTNWLRGSFEADEFELIAPDGKRLSYIDGQVNDGIGAWLQPIPKEFQVYFADQYQKQNWFESSYMMPQSIGNDRPLQVSDAYEKARYECGQNGEYPTESSRKTFKFFIPKRLEGVYKLRIFNRSSSNNGCPPPRSCPGNAELLEGGLSVTTTCDIPEPSTIFGLISLLSMGGLLKLFKKRQSS